MISFFLLYLVQPGEEEALRSLPVSKRKVMSRRERDFLHGWIPIGQGGTAGNGWALRSLPTQAVLCCVCAVFPLLGEQAERRG